MSGRPFLKKSRPRARGGARRNGKSRHRRDRSCGGLKDARMERGWSPHTTKRPYAGAIKSDCCARLGRQRGQEVWALARKRRADPLTRERRGKDSCRDKQQQGRRVRPNFKRGTDLPRVVRVPRKGTSRRALASATTDRGSVERISGRRTPTPLLRETAASPRGRNAPPRGCEKPEGGREAL